MVTLWRIDTWLAWLTRQGRPFVCALRGHLPRRVDLSYECSRCLEHLGDRPWVR